MVEQHLGLLSAFLCPSLRTPYLFIFHWASFPLSGRDDDDDGDGDDDDDDDENNDDERKEDEGTHIFLHKTLYINYNINILIII